MRGLISSVYPPFINPKFAPPARVGGLMFRARFCLYRERRLFGRSTWYVVRVVSDSYEYRTRSGEAMTGACRYIDHYWECESILDALWRYNKIVCCQPDWNVID